MENTTGYTHNAYSKKSVWKYILIYLIVAGVVYGIVYYLFFANKGFGYSQIGQNQNTTAQQNVNLLNSQANPLSGQNQMESKVTLTQDGYSPQTLTIKIGSPVTWINNSGMDATVSSDPHPTHTDYPPLNLDKFSDGGLLSLTFDKPGTYSYHNHLNPGDKGTIVVQ